MWVDGAAHHGTGAISHDCPPTPVLGLDWVRATSVERPTNFAEDPSAAPYTGTHPILRIPGQAMMADVIGLPSGGFVAVGYVPPDWMPAAWTSADGADLVDPRHGHDRLHLPGFPGRWVDGTVVAVGRLGQLPAAWTSFDGVAWRSIRAASREPATSPSA